MLRNVRLLAGIILALSACKAADRLPSTLEPDPAPEASNLTADQLVARYMAARGGEEKLRGIHSVRMSGAMTTREVNGGRTTVLIAPGRYLRRIVQGPDSTMVNAVAGDTSWEVSPRSGIAKPRPMSAADAARFRRLADPQGPLVDFRAKGERVEVVGKLPWHGLPVYKLKVTWSDGGADLIYLDAQSFLPVRTVGRLYVPPLGREIQVELVYRDYREAGGVKWPFAEQGRAPEVNFEQAIAWEQVEVNPRLAEALFKMPGA